MADALSRRPAQVDLPGVTIVTVNWNSWDFLRPMVPITAQMSPAGTRFLVVDNGSDDGSADRLRQWHGIELLSLPINLGHGHAIDLCLPRIRTPFVAILDVDAFPINPRWLEECLDSLESGYEIVGGHMTRNYVHPSFLVTRTHTIREMGLTFRPVGRMSSRWRRAPLFLDVAEAASQRVIVHRGGSPKLRMVSSSRVPDEQGGGVIFGDLVYHNIGATWGSRRIDALERWHMAIRTLHPGGERLLREFADVGGGEGRPGGGE